MRSSYSIIVPYDIPTKIYVDGASRGNPGPMGCGVVVIEPEREPKGYYGHYRDSGTNNQAELWSLHKALEVAKDYCMKGTPVSIVGDSEYALNCVFTWSDNWARNGWKNKKGQPVQNQDIIQACVKLKQSLLPLLQIAHVPGHKGIEGNELADQLANKAIDTQAEQWVEIYPYS